MSNLLTRYPGPAGCMLTVKTPVQRPLHSKNDLEGLRLGFQEEYIDPYDLVGETVKEIKDNVTEYCNNKDKYVAPYTSLVTSSMMGKSRLMKEIARSIPSVYMCFRAEESSGYPARTPHLPEWINKGVMAQVPMYDTAPDMRFVIPTLKFCMFLLTLIRNLCTLVDKNHGREVGQMDPYLWMWQFFAEPATSEDIVNRDQFWDKVIHEAGRELRKQSLPENNLVNAAYAYLRAVFGAEVSHAYTSLKKAFGISNDTDFTLLLICDEARILCDLSAIDGKIIPTTLDLEPETRPIQTDRPPFSNFRAFRRALRYLTLAAKSRGGKITDPPASELAVSKKRVHLRDRTEHPPTSKEIPRIFALLTDTSSRLTNFQPAAWEDRSLRVLSLPTLGNKQFDPIFTFTSIDAHSMYLNDRCTSNIDLVAKPRRLLKFGRAGWYSVGRHLEMDPVDFAMVKLAGGTEAWHRFFETAPGKPLSSKTRLALLAILAPRLAVTAGPNVREAAEIIASHLAILMRTDADRHFLRTAFPSEPVVAEASAQITGELGWGQVLRALYTSVQTGIVEGGFRGELLSNILCLMAVDKSQPVSTTGLWEYTRPVKVSDFLNNFIQPPGEDGDFISPTAAIEALAAKSLINPTMARRFLNGHVFFNHFIHVEEALTMPLLVQAWNRGAALMCKPNTELVDHVITVMLASEPNKPPEFGPLYGEWTDAQTEEARQHVACILINSKCYAKPTNHDKSAFKMTANEDNIKFSLDKDGNKSMFELNILQEFGPKQPRREPHNVSLHVHPAGPAPTQQLFFVLKELSATTYKCLESLDEKTDGKMALMYLEKLREGKVDYDNDLVKKRKFKRLAARHDSLPIVFGATPKSSMEDWDNFRARLNDFSDPMLQD